MNEPTPVKLSGKLEVSSRLSEPCIQLKVPQPIVRGLYASLREPGIEVPPTPAHITVITSKELASLGGQGKITERGQEFPFATGKMYSVAPGGWRDVSKVYFVRCTSPELKRLRVSYGLSPLPKGQEFHITVAIRKRGVLSPSDPEVKKAAEVFDDESRAKKRSRLKKVLIGTGLTGTALAALAYVYSHRKPMPAPVTKQTADSSSPTLKQTADSSASAPPVAPPMANSGNAPVENAMTDFQRDRANVKAIAAVNAYNKFIQGVHHTGPYPRPIRNLARRLFRKPPIMGHASPAGAASWRDSIYTRTGGKPIAPMSPLAAGSALANAALINQVLHQGYAVNEAFGIGGSGIEGLNRQFSDYYDRLGSMSKGRQVWEGATALFRPDALTTMALAPYELAKQRGAADLSAGALASSVNSGAANALRLYQSGDVSRQRAAEAILRQGRNVPEADRAGWLKSWRTRLK